MARRIDSAAQIKASDAALERAVASQPSGAASGKQAHPTYPSADIDRTARGARTAAGGCPVAAGAPVAKVAPGSPADDAGFTPGCFICAVNGEPIRDLIDWRWLSADDAITVSYVDADGDAGEVELERDWDEPWGFEFDGLVFDDVQQCRNACTFCFMHQLPQGMRPSLTLRDDDFRLSFLVGTFVTLTNITPADEERIVAQSISPLHVSLQASDPDLRRRLIGKHAQHGIEVLDRLLAAGIEFHAQIVLVPGVNDGDQLKTTLGWAYERPGIMDIGIVPLGYTRFQERFDHSYNDADAARALLAVIEPYQKRALSERGTPWVFAADEFYSNAHPDDLLSYLPPAEWYGAYELFEDGIGIVRSTVDDWERAEQAGAISSCAEALRAQGAIAVVAVGCAQREFLTPLVERSRIGDVFSPLYVENDFFGGNVDVTGLLVGADVARALRRDRAARPQGQRVLYLVMSVCFNDDEVMLDDMRIEDVETAAGVAVHVVSCSPFEYFPQIEALARAGHFA